MFCINCFHPNTRVANSRPQRKAAQVWRRRMCPQCQTAFTTYERPSLAENKQIALTHNKTDTFNLGKLIISIAKAFTHNQYDAEYSALWLAQSVENKLTVTDTAITTSLIATTTHDTLKHFDELAAVQYAAQHKLISSTRRRGRPSWREHEQYRDALPSQ